MNHRRRVVLACAGIVGIFLLVQLGAIALVEPFQAEGFQQVEDTSDPTISVLYIGAILVVTALMLLAMKYGGDDILRYVILFAAVYISYWVLSVIAPDVLSPTIGGNPVDVIAIGGALVIGAALLVYPEWYVIDATGILMGIGAAGLFGINFGLFPALVLLAALAVYDAISVYGTEHMLTLASGVMEMRVPVVFVVPLSLSYSFLDSDTPAVTDEETDTSEVPSAEELNELGAKGIESLDDETLAAIDEEAVAAIDEETMEALDEDVREQLRDERDALFIGLGDAVIPTVLVASAAFFVESGPTLTVLGVTAPLPALTAMAGTLVGLVILLWMVLKGRAHAGLPLLNGGTIAGYLVGALASGLTLAEALGLSGGLL